MKLVPVLSASVIFGLIGCETMNGPISSGSFDPLAPPGSSLQNSDGNTGASSFRAGQFVSAAVDHTAFFSRRPNGDADADKTLSRDTRMKVISSDNSYVKVELDSGEVGFVPAVMVVDPSAEQAALPGVDGAYQVYPPLPHGAAGDPLPVFDETGLPPEGAIPTVIDPEAPAPAPAPGSDVPLPPGLGEELPVEPEAAPKPKEEKKADEE